jgi:hypothetical protein
MAERGLIDELRAIAKEEGVSLAEVIRQGLEWRASTRRRIPSFVKRRSQPPVERRKTAPRAPRSSSSSG